MLIVGGGYIACEFAGIMNGLGVKTTQFYRGAQILRGFDDEARGLICEEMCQNGVDVHLGTTRKLLNWLRREARRGLTIGGLCTAAWTLARAGLLDGKRATIHWENHDSFAEEFEEVTLTKQVFVMDGNRLSTAGGTSSIDLMLKLIADDHGEDLANAVADQLIYSAIRTDQDTQRLSVPTRIGVRHPKLAQVIHRMEANVEDPLSPALLTTVFTSLASWTLEPCPSHCRLRFRNSRRQRKSLVVRIVRSCFRS